jgi:hypothetical protein
MDIREIVSSLDGLGDDDRIKTVVSLGRRQLSALYEMASGNPPLQLTDLVPAQVPPDTEVIHEGKNSLGVFTRFQKRFYRPAGNTTELWGYNEQSFRGFTGPGYFVAHYTPRGELVVDYRVLPPDKLAAWPTIIPNSARLSRFIYNGTVDYLRRVSRNVVIGRAYRREKPMNAWFALVRREVGAAGVGPHKGGGAGVKGQVQGNGQRNGKELAV